MGGYRKKNLTAKEQVTGYHRVSGLTLELQGLTPELITLPKTWQYHLLGSFTFAKATRSSQKQAQRNSV